MRRFNIRDFHAYDYRAFKVLHKDNCEFPLPDLNNNLYFCKKTVEDSEGRIVGFGIVRLTSESILIIDNTLPAITRARIIRELIKLMIDEVITFGMDETHAFVASKFSKLKRFLVRACGFIECKDASVFKQF